MTARIDLILIKRLQEWHPTEFLCGAIWIKYEDLEYLENAEVVTEHRQYCERNIAYHRGRIKYFLTADIDPITLDNVCDGKIYAEPVIVDGHHRLIAAILRGYKTIPTYYGGRIDLLDYLTGKTEEKPED